MEGKKEIGLLSLLSFFFFETLSLLLLGLREKFSPSRKFLTKTYLCL